MKREQACQALYNKLAAIPAWKTISRKLKHWSDVPPIEQPACFIRQTNENYERTRGIPPKITLHFEVAVYAMAPDPNDNPSSLQNELLDLIDDALAPDDPTVYTCTLGKNVSHCWIEGQVETDEGLLGQQTVAIIPVNILITY